MPKGMTCKPMDLVAFCTLFVYFLVLVLLLRSIDPGMHSYQVRILYGPVGELIGTAFAIGGLAVMTLSSGAAGSEKEVLCLSQTHHKVMQIYSHKRIVRDKFTIQSQVARQSNRRESWMWACTNLELLASLRPLYLLCSALQGSKNITSITEHSRPGWPIIQWFFDGLQGLLVAIPAHQVLVCHVQATVYGDIMGLAGSILFTLYLLIGRSLRTWMPIFAYVLPVNGTAALGLCASAVVLEGAGFNGSLTGLFGQFFHWQYFWRCFYMAAVPGIVGHVSFNALLKWLHPLIIALPSRSSALCLWW